MDRLFRVGLCVGLAAQWAWPAVGRAAADPTVGVLWLPQGGEPASELADLYQRLPQAVSLLQDPRAFSVHPMTSASVSDALRDADPRVRGHDCADDDSWMWQRFVPGRLAPLVHRAGSDEDLRRALALHRDLLDHAPCTWAPVTASEVRNAWVVAGQAALRLGIDEAPWFDAAVSAQPSWDEADDLTAGAGIAWAAASARHWSHPGRTVRLAGTAAVLGDEVRINGTALSLPLPAEVPLWPGTHLIQVLRGAEALTAVFSVPGSGELPTLDLDRLFPELSRDPDAELRDWFTRGQFPDWAWRALLLLERRRGHQYTFLATRASVDDVGAAVPGLRVWYLDPTEGPSPLPREMWGTAVRPGGAHRLLALFSRQAWRGRGLGAALALGYGTARHRHWLSLTGLAHIRVYRAVHAAIGGGLGSNLGFQANGGADDGGRSGLGAFLVRAGGEVRLPAGAVRPYLGFGALLWGGGAGDTLLAPELRAGIDFRRLESVRGPYFEGQVSFPRSMSGAPWAVTMGWRWDP